jgi:hypothetical protein
MAYLSQKYRLVGIAPLIVHNGQTRDPLNQFAKALKKVSSKRNKTDADHEEMARIEWYASLYIHEGRPCIPGDNWERMLLDAAKRRKLGKEIPAATYCPGFSLIEYKGPATVDELWADERFRITKPVKVKQAAVMRTRAIFEEWACTMEIKYDPEMIDLQTLHELMKIASESIGAGDWRPKFGRFTVEPVD